eukprot:Nk52_evm41s24 gene=Nk52_evmTU41s24
MFEKEKKKNGPRKMFLSFCKWKLKNLPDANMALKTATAVRLAKDNEKEVTLLLPGGLRVASGATECFDPIRRTCSVKVEEVKVANAMVTTFHNNEGDSRQTSLTSRPPFSSLS